MPAYDGLRPLTINPVMEVKKWPCLVALLKILQPLRPLVGCDEAGSLC
jgi:hypothetical protein